MRLESLVHQHAEILEDFIVNARYTALVFMNRQFHISAANQAFLFLLNLKDDITGTSIEQYLQEESFHSLRSSGEYDNTTIQLHFLGNSQPALTLEAQIIRSETHVILLCEMSRLTGTDIIEKMSMLNNELINLSRELSQKNTQLEKALSEIKQLRGLIPICSHCKKIRNDSGFWQQVEEYISEHSEALFSHGVCPTCMKNLYSEYLED